MKFCLPSGGTRPLLRDNDDLWLYIVNTSRASDVGEQIAAIFEKQLGYQARQITRLAWGKWKAGPIINIGGKE